MEHPVARPSATSDESVDQVIALWGELIGKAILYNEQVARTIGINAIDLQTFGVLTRHDGPASPTAVAKQTGLPASTTTRVLDRLEEAGFIARRAVPGDRRKIAIEAVPAKAAEVASYYSEKVAQIRELNAKRTDSEVAAVISYLRELTAVDDS